MDSSLYGFDELNPRKRAKNIVPCRTLVLARRWTDISPPEQAQAKIHTLILGDWALSETAWELRTLGENLRGKSSCNRIGLAKNKEMQRFDARSSPNGIVYIRNKRCSWDAEAFSFNIELIYTSDWHNAFSVVTLVTLKTLIFSMLSVFPLSHFRGFISSEKKQERTLSRPTSGIFRDWDDRDITVAFSTPAGNCNNYV